MPQLENLVETVFSGHGLRPSDIPRLDLYMDQVLALFDEGFASDKRAPSDKLLTKTMVNNYVKEGLVTPVRGKKYTRQQVMQLLCVYHLKQALKLSDVKALTGGSGANFEACCERLLEAREQMTEIIPPLLAKYLPHDISSPDDRLTLCLILSEIAVYMRNLCETLIDTIPEQTGGV